MTYTYHGKEWTRIMYGYALCIKATVCNSKLKGNRFVKASQLSCNIYKLNYVLCY